MSRGLFRSRAGSLNTETRHGPEGVVIPHSLDYASPPSNPTRGDTSRAVDLTALCFAASAWALMLVGMFIIDEMFIGCVAILCQIVAGILTCVRLGYPRPLRGPLLVPLATLLLILTWWLYVWVTVSRALP